MAKIYVASSWRNDYQAEVVQALRAAGHEVYDFKNPSDNGGTGFHWSDIDPDWETWTPEEFAANLNHPIAVEGFDRDFKAMEWCNVMLLVMPCGRSAHLELGWGCGDGKQTAILLSDGEPELMYRTAKNLFVNLSEVIVWVNNLNLS